MKKITVGTTLVLPAADMVLGILERAELFSLQPGNELFKTMLEQKLPHDNVVGINRISVAELVVALYLDQLHGFCKWTPQAGTDFYYDSEMVKLVKGWKDLSSQQQKAFYTEVIQPAYEEVHDWVLEFDRDQDSWHIWYVRRLGLDVIVEKGTDYRILDWERRMALAADHQRAVDEGETPPEGAWLPDDEAQRFVTLLMQQQKAPSPLGKSTMDALDQKRRELAEKRTRRRGKGVL